MPPRASYRLQLHAGFDLDAATALVPYLAALGVSHVYTSPLLQAAAGSTHGYDVVDPTRVGAELGGEHAYRRFTAALRAHGLGQIVDVVPNHMAIAGAENPWWWDVLESGPASRFAGYFDVDWEPPEARLRNTVLLPILGDHYGRELEAGALRLEHAGGAFRIRYRDHSFPVSPRSLAPLFEQASIRCGSETLAFLADACATLPHATATDWESVERRHRGKTVLRRQLARLLAEEPAVGAALDLVVAAVNADPDALDALLQRQNYRLAYWRAADRDLGYRRFFDVDALVAMRIEDPRVFGDTHARILEWLADGVVDGLRVDHPDGLLDPTGYLTRLREAAPHARILVEKVLVGDERLHAAWPVDGTTGYEFLRRVLLLQIDAAGLDALGLVYARFLGHADADGLADPVALARAKKRLAVRDLLGSDANRLAALFLEVCERQRRYRDHTRHELHEALIETVACFPVYRAYVRPGEPVDVDDAEVVARAIAAAKAERPDLDPQLLDFLRDLLLLRIPGDREAELALRFQQLTGPATAKGVEDTAFYCEHRLVALNEVGLEPGARPEGVDAFHRAAAATAERAPLTMLATSTHDTKRSEDVRARLACLSEIPERFAVAVRGFAALAERLRHDGLPDRNTEYLYYQSLVGAWPLSVERAQAYMEKAAREAKEHTTWTTPDVVYEQALASFVRGTLGDPAFCAAVDELVATLIEPGRVNALAALLLKLTAPGVPDLYQGSELWDLSLVDPDNRRPVDFAYRQALLAALDGATPEDVLARSDEGLPKLWTVRQALALRGRRPEAFAPGSAYAPIGAIGAAADHVVAFARGGSVVTVVPRLVLRLAGAWGTTTLALPPGRFTNVLTGERVEGGARPVAALFARFPVALLAREPA